jgi:putative transposase
VESLRHLLTVWSDLPDLRAAMGIPKLARSTVADANHSRPHEFVRALLAQVLHACGKEVKSRPHGLKRIVNSLDSTTIELCDDLFPWAVVSRQRAAIKLHVLHRNQAALPELTFIADGKTHDLPIAKQMPIPPGSILVMDRAYVDAEFFARLHDEGTTFVTRMKRGTKYRVLRRRKVPANAIGVLADQEIILTGRGAPVYDGRPLRRISYRDPVTGKRLVYLTNSLRLAARTIARLYKDRWEVETFFKWIKQNLRVLRFWGRSPNAVLTQLWVALLAYALVSWINLKLRTTWTRLRTWRYVQTYLLLPSPKDFFVADP